MSFFVKPQQDKSNTTISQAREKERKKMIRKRDKEDLEEMVNEKKQLNDEMRKVIESDMTEDERMFKKYEIDRRKENLKKILEDPNLQFELSRDKFLAGCLRETPIQIAESEKRLKQMIKRRKSREKREASEIKKIKRGGTHIKITL